MIMKSQNESARKKGKQMLSVNSGLNSQMTVISFSVIGSNHLSLSQLCSSYLKYIETRFLSSPMSPIVTSPFEQGKSSSASLVSPPIIFTDDAKGGFAL